MGNFLDYVNSQNKKKSTTKGAFGNSVAERKIGLDTFESDLRSASNIVNKVYGGWQSADTMKNSYQAVSSMRDRLGAYRSHVNNNSNGKDLTEFNTNMDKLIKSYDAALTDWDKLSTEYGKYSDAVSYNSARMRKKLADSPRAKEGWQKYLADIESKGNAGEKPSVGETLLQGMGDTSSDSFIGTAINNVINMKRNDTTHREPAQDWTDDERYIFGVYYLESPEKAYQYAAKLNEEKNIAAKNAQKQKVTENATSGFGSGLGHTVGALLTAPTGLLDFMDDVTSFAANKPITENGVMTPFEYSQTVTGGISSKLNEKYGTLNDSIPLVGGKGIGDVYGLGTGIAQSAASGKLIGPAGTLISYFGQGAASKIGEALSRGATNEQAMLLGAIVGAAEGASEYIGADRLLNIGDIPSATIKEAFREVFKQAGAEGIEEGFSSVVGEIADKFVMQDKSMFNSSLQEYIGSGMGEEEATKKAFIDSFERIAYDSIAGAVSGGVHASPHVVQTQAGNSYIGKEITKNDRRDTLAGIAQNEGDAYSNYISLLNSGKASNAKVGSLYRKMENAAVRDKDGARLSELSRVFSPKTEEEAKIQEKVATYNIGNNTTDNITGNAVNIRGIRTDGSGNTVLKTNMGERTIDSVTLNRGDAELVAMAEGMEESRADLFVSMYNGQDATQYKDSFDLVYAYGKNAFGVENAMKRHGVLTESQALQVYKLGVSERTAAPQTKADAITEKYFSEGGTVKAGTFSDKGVNYNKLNSRQKAAASFAKMFSKATGVNVVLFESKADENGVRTAENGRYEKGTNTVYIDVYAGFKENEGVFEDSMIPTMSHEVTHWMKEKAPEAYAKLSEIVMDTLSREHNAHPEVLVAYEKQNHKKRGRDVSDEYAQDEIIARACEDMLSGNKTANEIIEQMDEETAKTFSEKFKEVVSKIRAWLKELLGVYKSNSEEAKILRRYDDKLAELQKAWDEGLEKAVKANQAMQNSETEDVAASERTQYSDRNENWTLKGYSEKQLENWKNSKRIVVYENYMQLMSFVNEAIRNKTFNKKMYFGMVSDELADEMLSRFNVDIHGFNVSISGNEIRKTLNEHGKEENEAPRGQRAVQKEDFAAIPFVMEKPSEIENGGLYNGKPLFNFRRDGYTVAGVVSDKHLDLFVQTMYVNKKNRSLATATDEQASVNTSETTSGTASKDSIPHNSENIKENVQFSDRVTYSYEYLTRKPDMKVTYVEDVGAIDRKDVVKKAISNVKEVGFVNENGNAMVRVDDIEKDIMVPKHSITHGMDRRFANQAPVLIHIGEVLKNSIRINELNPRSENISDSYILLGAARGDNSFYTVSFVVNSYTGEVDKIEVLYSANVKTEPAALLPTVTEKNSATPTDSTISIANLLGFVNKHFPDLLSEDVLKHFGHDRRPNGRIGNDVLFSDRDSNGNGLTPGQMEFFKNSKLRDENGNLKVMYHGTETASFTVFDSKYANDGISLFFTDNEKVAKGYSGTYEEYIPGKKYTVEELTDIIGNSYLFVEEEDGKYNIVRNRYGDFINEYTTDTLEEMQEYVLAEYASVGAGNYKVYLNLTNPLVIDADSNNWDEIPVPAELKDAISTEISDTRTIAKYAKERGYDGVIFDNLYDIAVYAAGSEKVELSTVAVAFNSDQIKSVYNENPTTDSDIRYSERSTESIYDAVGELKRIQRENDKLKADIERLRKKNRLERTVTGGRELNESHIASVAGHVLNMADSRYSKADLATELKGIYEYLRGEDVEWNTAMSKLLDVARKVVGEKTVHNDYAKGILDMVRKERISFSDEQKAEAESMFGKNWISNYFGKMIIANDGRPFADVWSEWANRYPDVFDSGVSDSEMMSEVLNAYEIVKTAKDVSETYFTSEAARGIALEIYNQYWNFFNAESVEVKQLKYEHRNEMKELRDRHNTKPSEKEIADNLMQKNAYLVKYFREKRTADIQRIRENSHEYTKAYRDKMKRNDIIRNIQKKALKLSKLLTKNSRDYHIPEILKEPVVELLKSLDFSSERLLGVTGGDMAGVPTKKDISLQKAFDNLEKALNKSIAIDEYDELGLPQDFVEFVAKANAEAQGLMIMVGDNEFILHKMDVEQLEDLNRIVTIMQKVVSQTNKALASSRGAMISELAEDTIKCANEIGEKNPHVGTVSDFVNHSNTLPYYFFKKLGAGARHIFEGMQDGWDKFAFNVKAIMDYTSDKNTGYKAKEARAWGKEIHEFDILNGKNKVHVRMTAAQMMSLYCLNKREQGKNHLLVEGMRVKDFKNGTKNISQPKGSNLTEKDIEMITSKLTKRQKDVADSLQRFMNNECSEMGNDVTMKLYGYRAFTEENYFPITSDKNGVGGNKGPQAKGNKLVALLNMSFTKSLKPKAGNRVEIDNIFDVFAGHASDMAKYNALAVPALDAYRWYYYKKSQKVSDDVTDPQRDPSSVRESLENTYGSGAKEYIEKFIEDINGAESTRPEAAERFAKKMISNYKVAAVGANLRVAVLQPTAYLRASAVLDPKYLAKGLLHLPQIQKAKDNCGMALWKSMGFYNTDIAAGVAEQIKHAESGWDKAREVSMKLAEWGDAMTWGYLYNACEAEISEKQPKLTGAEKDKAVVLRLREIIYSTQVVDSTMTRTQMMRSKSVITQMYTSFMSEPMMSYNLLLDGYTQYNAEKRRTGSASAALRKTKKVILRSVLTYGITSLTAAAMGGIVDTLRDDEEDEEFADAYISNIVENLISDVLGMVPIMKEAFSVVQGYSPTRMDEAFMTSTWNAVKKVTKLVFSEDRDLDYKTVYSVLKAMSQINGLPAGSLFREVIAIWNNTVGEVYESMKYK